ncbi:hypothetical protein M080_7151, partial [Bacteroides fragilis str. 3397 T10]
MATRFLPSNTFTSTLSAEVVLAATSTLTELL